MNNIKDINDRYIYKSCNRMTIQSAADYLWDMGCKLDKIQDQKKLGDKYRILANDLYYILFFDYDDGTYNPDFDKGTSIIPVIKNMVVGQIEEGKI